MSAENVEELVRLLEVEELDDNLYRGAAAPNQRGRAFGGLVAAQAVMSAIRTAPEGHHLHSMHSYFLLPGDPNLPIIYDVERIRDGRSFVTRRVSARQHGHPIYFLTANFQVVEGGHDHQDVMPEAPSPDSGLSVRDLMVASGNPHEIELAREWGALDIRFVGRTHEGLEDDPMRPSLARMWIKIATPLPDDPHIHLGAFTYASDISLLGASLAAHGVTPQETMMASLDHAIWFHRPFRADEWWLYDQWSPSASGGRGFSIGRVFTQAGELVATVAQEGVIRPLRHPQRSS